jgi:HK97 family phage prohead protease
MIRYNVKSSLISEGRRQFFEVMAPGVFKHSLASRGDIILTAGHKSDNPLNCIGRWPAGGLSVNDSGAGLDWSCQLPGTSAATDLHRLVNAGVITGASFEFIVDAGGDSWTKNADGTELRTITSATLLEINPCAAPAYPDNTLEARRRSDPHSSWQPCARDRHLAARLGIII